MWCKKRRRNKEGKIQDDNSRSSSNKQTKKDSTSSGTKPVNVGGTETEQALKTGNGASVENVSLTTAGGLKDSLSKVYMQKKMHNNSLSEGELTFDKDEKHSNDVASVQPIDGEDNVVQKMTDRNRRQSDSLYVESDGRIRDKISDHL